jgi:hypothetical protein
MMITHISHIISSASILFVSSSRMSPTPKPPSKTVDPDTPPVLYPYTLSDPTPCERVKGPGRPRATRGRPPKQKNE